MEGGELLDPILGHARRHSLRMGCVINGQTFIPKPPITFRSAGEFRATSQLRWYPSDTYRKLVSNWELAHSARTMNVEISWSPRK
jgi:hypothetical protein